MRGLSEAPGMYLGFISLHVLAGHLGSSLVYRLRFGRSPLAYRSAAADSAHTRVTRRISGVSLLWAGSVLAAAFWPAWSVMPWGRPLLPLPPLAGWVLGVVGLLGMLWAQYAMGPAFRIGVDAGEARPQLHEGGLHRSSRNPIYVFSYLYLVGAWLAGPRDPRDDHAVHPPRAGGPGERGAAAHVIRSVCSCPRPQHMGAYTGQMRSRPFSSEMGSQPSGARGWSRSIRAPSCRKFPCIWTMRASTSSPFRRGG